MGAEGALRRRQVGGHARAVLLAVLVARLGQDVAARAHRGRGVAVRIAALVAVEVVRVRLDVDQRVGRQLPELVPAEERRQVAGRVVDERRDDPQRRGHVLLTQDRQRAVAERAIAVVEGEHQDARWEPFGTGARGHHLAQRQEGPAGRAAGADLVAQELGRHGLLRGAGGVGDVVVAQDGDEGRIVRRRAAQAGGRGSPRGTCEGERDRNGRGGAPSAGRPLREPVPSLRPPGRHQNPRVAENAQRCCWYPAAVDRSESLRPSSSASVATRSIAHWARNEPLT